MKTKKIDSIDSRNVVIGNHNCRIFPIEEYSVFGNNEYIGFGNKSEEKIEIRNT